LGNAKKIAEVTEPSEVETPEFPLTPAKVLKFYRKYLSNFEQSEILQYQIVYYINTSEEDLELNKKLA
jgi:hypothetical protein